MAEHVAVEVHDASLPAGIGEELGRALGQPHAGIRDDQPDAFQAALLQMLEEARPACLVLLGALHDAEDLAIAFALTAIATSSETLRTSPAQLRFITMPSR